ncbi:unnamed protein product [Polarella glacialis]|uniref:Uncharacterized protein n=1 Tax=Polarella glacialis TaxID=89957 RepID=A0A813J846_POLGL|nr:unnamed protein product [Polarella glacialis]
MTKFALIAALGAIASVSAAGPAAVNLGKAGSNVSAEEAEECSHMQRAHAKSVGQEAVAVKDDGYHFELDIEAEPGVTITGKAFIADLENAPNGCGSGFNKCTCAYTDSGFKMRGWGTTGTLTGLEFQCTEVKFSIPGQSTSSCSCKFRIMIAKWGRSRSIKTDCEPKQCFVLKNNPRKGKGTVHDLFSRFDNPNGVGDVNAVDWMFHLLAEGSGGPAKPAQVLGGWHAVAAGAGLAIKQSVTWSKTSTKTDANEVSSSLTVGTKFTYSNKMGVAVPAVGSAESTMGVEVSASVSQGWKQTITSTMSNTAGGTRETTCTPNACPGGTTYQWQAGVSEKSWAALFDSCFFVCMPNQGTHPKCPQGACCSKDATDQCSSCSVQWCDKSKPDCPKFVVGCGKASGPR